MLSGEPSLSFVGYRRRLCYDVESFRKVLHCEREHSLSPLFIVLCEEDDCNLQINGSKMKAEKEDEDSLK